MAHPDARVVQIAGDGAFGFHLQELDTMVRHNLPIVSVVYNNVSWGMSLHGQEAMFGRGSGVISRLRDTDYDRVGMAFGAYGERVRDFEEIGPAVRRALDRYGLPADVAGVALFLASDDSQWMTGQTLYVDGGASMRAYPNRARFESAHVATDPT